MTIDDSAAAAFWAVSGKLCVQWRAPQNDFSGSLHFRKYFDECTFLPKYSLMKIISSRLRFTPLFLLDYCFKVTAPFKCKISRGADLGCVGGGSGASAITSF